MKNWLSFAPHRPGIASWPMGQPVNGYNQGPILLEKPLDKEKLQLSGRRSEGAFFVAAYGLIRLALHPPKGLE
jgi:hypothetical protein